MAVVHFDDLDVEILVECGCNLGGEGRKQVHTQAHIAGLDDAGLPRGFSDSGGIVAGETGRANDVGNAMLGGQAGEPDGGLRGGKVQNCIRRGNHVCGLRTDG